MEINALESAPLWLEKSRPRFASLKADASFDVVIIGGGITGLTAAWFLKQAGKSVAVFDKGRIGDAETGHTTAHLTYVTDARLSRLADVFGEDGARRAWHGGAAAIDFIEETARDLQIDCHFRRVPGYLHAPVQTRSDESKSFQEEAKLARKLGLEAAFVDDTPVMNRPGIRFAKQAHFHPIEYLAGLARAIHGDGCELHENSEITDFEESPLSVLVRGFTVTCDRLIVATHVPLMGLTSLPSAMFLQSKIAGYTSYALRAVLQGEPLPQASFWDTNDPYDYLRIDPGSTGQSLIFGGEDHKTGLHDDPEACYARLANRLKQIIPAAEIDHRWSGQVLETNDGLPYIGPTTDNQFVATGFSGNGLTFGTLSGRMAADWILNRKNEWQELFDVHRTKIRGGMWDYVKENVDYPLHLISGFVKTPDVKSVDDVAAGEGHVVKIDGQRCAVHRTEEGELVACSAICTHMGCVVRWNSAEKTWDCPCHGSRFGTDGHIIAGPAETALEKVDLSSSTNA